MGSRDDVNALPTLLVLQDAGIVFSCQDKQEVLALPLKPTLCYQRRRFLKQEYLSSL